MHRPAPLLGALTGLVDRSCSRIPHLRVHILLRQSRRKLSSRIAGYQPQRWTTSTAPTGSAASLTRSQRAAPLQFGDGEEDGPSADGSSKVEGSHKVTIEELVQEGDAERIWLGLQNPAGTDFIEHADDATFASALQAIDPDQLFDEFKDVYRYITPSLQATPVYRWTRSLESRFEAFSSRLDWLIRTRRRGRKLTLPTYRWLLECARVMGDGKMADNVFSNLMREDGVMPDHACYNSTMEAICWNGAFNKPTQWRFRVTQAHQEIRASQAPSPDLDNIPVARGQKGKASSVRTVILDRFKELVASGLSGDERTFTNLIVALGREGDLAGVKSVLKSVWNIDVDQLGTYDEEELESPTFYEDNSPLRPSHRLLFTVAHVFGSNNDVGTAFSLTDYISRNYNLDIPRFVWLQLCEWTHLVTMPRSNQQIRQGQDAGKVDAHVFQHLWQSMTDQPHNIMPDVPMLMLRVKSVQATKQFDQALDGLRQARGLVERQRRLLDELLESMLDRVHTQREALSKLSDSGVLPSDILDMRYRFILASLRLDRDVQLLSVAVRRYFYHLPPRRRERHARTVPDLVLEFADFIPNELNYATANGRVTLQGEAARTAALDEANGSQLRKLGIMRALIDRDKHRHIVQGLLLMPSYATDTAPYCWRCGRPGHLKEACTVAVIKGHDDDGDSRENDELANFPTRLLPGDDLLAKIRREYTSRPLPVYARLLRAKSRHGRNG